MASELGVELEPYEEVGDLNFSTPVESRSASPYERSTLTFKEPIQQVETISPCATTYPWSDPADSHAVIPQVPWNPGSCHNGAVHVGLEAKLDDRTEPVLFSREQTEPLLEALPRRSDTARTQVLDVGQRDLTHQRLASAPTMTLDEPLVSQSQPLSSSWMSAITARINLWQTVHGGSTTSTTDRHYIVSANIQPQHNVPIQRNSETT